MSVAGPVHCAPAEFDIKPANITDDKCADGAARRLSMRAISSASAPSAFAAPEYRRDPQMGAAAPTLRHWRLHLRVHARLSAHEIKRIEDRLRWH